MIARHIAISEALERWAYHVTVRLTRRAEYGFDVDGSSSGMAAFPGITKAPARRSARLEAIERFCLLNWWEGRIDGEYRKTKWQGIKAISLRSPIGGVAVILFTRSSLGYYAYGHAAGNNINEASDRALIELVRHEWAIKNWEQTTNLGPPSNLFEHRSWFFSTEEGHALFANRIETKARRSNPNISVVCDVEIPGPWSAYATVWRFALRPPSGRFVSDDNRYFFW